MEKIVIMPLKEAETELSLEPFIKDGWKVISHSFTCAGNSYAISLHLHKDDYTYTTNGTVAYQNEDDFKCGVVCSNESFD